MVVSIGAVLVILAAVLGSSVLMAVFALLWYRLRKLESGNVGASELLRLGEEVDGLRAELQATHADISDLSERLDFTERLLSPGDGPEGP